MSETLPLFTRETAFETRTPCRFCGDVDKRDLDCPLCHGEGYSYAPMPFQTLVSGLLRALRAEGVAVPDAPSDTSGALTRPASIAVPQSILCEICGKPTGKPSNAKVCSPACRIEKSRRYAREYAAAHVPAAHAPTAEPDEVAAKPFHWDHPEIRRLITAARESKSAINQGKFYIVNTGGASAAPKGRIQLAVTGLDKILLVATATNGKWIAETASGETRDVGAV